MDTLSGSVGAGATAAAALPTLPSAGNPFLTGSTLSFSFLNSWPSLAAVFALYVAICSSLRFRHEKAMRRRFRYTDRSSLAKMSNDDASEILKTLIVYEFPKMYRAALEFAIFKVSQLAMQVERRLPVEVCVLTGGTLDLRHRDHIEADSCHKELLGP